MAVAVARVTTPDLTFDHLVSLTTPLGLFEHALGRPPPARSRLLPRRCRPRPRRHRAAAGPGGQVIALSRVYLEFTLGAQDDRGRFRNRRRANGTWMGDANVDDHWGRASGASARPRTAAPTSTCGTPPSARRPWASRPARPGPAPPRTRPSAPTRSCAPTPTTGRTGPPHRRAHPARAPGGPPRLAVARAPPHVRQRRAPRGAARHRLGAGRRPRAGGRPRAAVVAGRAGDPRRPPVGHPRRRLAPRRAAAGLRPAADRGLRPGRGLLARLRDHRRQGLADVDRTLRRLVPRRRTTSGSPSTTRPAAAGPTACTPTGSTRTRGPSPPWPAWPPSSSARRAAAPGRALSRPTRPLVRRTPHVLRPDPARVVTKIFLPGQELAASARSRSTAVLDRVLALSEEEVERVAGDSDGLVRPPAPRPRDTLEATSTWSRTAWTTRRRCPPSGASSSARTSRRSTRSRPPPCSTPRWCRTPTRPAWPAGPRAS